MCSESQSAYEDFLEINKDSNEPCIKAVSEALKDHNENCKTANSKNKEIIIADFLIKEWVELINDYRRALGGKKPDNEDPVPLKPGEDKRGYLGGPEWGGLNDNLLITKGGGFSICTQPVKYNRGVNPSSGAKLELCGFFDSDCDPWDNFEKDHTTHWNCRHSMGLTCTSNRAYNTSSQTRGFANLGTEMCFREGMPYESFYDGPPGCKNCQLSAIGHSTGYRTFIRDRCGTHGCSPKKPTTDDLKCSDATGNLNTNKYWGSQLLECGYNKTGIELRLLEFPKTRLGRGKFLDRISENSKKIHGTGDNIITEDDVLDYYISKLNATYSDAKLTKENIRENTDPIKNSAGFAAEGVIDNASWNPDPTMINEIVVDSEKSEQVDKLILPNCCSNTINLGDGSRAMLSDINQSCSIQSDGEDNTEQNNVSGDGPPVDDAGVNTPPVGAPVDPTTPPTNPNDGEDTTWDVDIENWFKDENNRPIIWIGGGSLLLLILFLIFG
tara:strand:+ start:66 stop:1559 length:1494 start_codon:yes stop_codon:yes gene_type:complete